MNLKKIRLTFVLICFVLFIFTGCNNFNRNSFKVIFKNEDGSILQEKKFSLGETPVYTGDIPSKEDGAQSHYTFSGWIPELEEVKGDIEYIAYFEEVFTQYEVIFIGMDDNEIKRQLVTYGDKATAPFPPYIEGYTFINWNKDFSNISEDLLVKAIYKKNKYIVNFLDEDGSVLQTQEYWHGEVPEYLGTIPYKEPTYRFTYTFIGWEEEIKAVTKKCNYHAKYKINYPDYYVLASDDDFKIGEDGGFIYTGDDKYVIVPEYIQGVKITKVTERHDRMFRDSPYIIGVVFENPKNIISLEYLFFGNKSEHIELYYLDTSSVTDMHGMFQHCATSNLDLSSLDTSKVKNMVYMFAFTDITNLDLSAFDTSSVTDMLGMFYYSQFENLDLSSFNTSSVTNMRSMFSDSIIINLDLSSFDTSSVTDMSRMFFKFGTLDLDLSSFDTSEVINMTDMFTDSSMNIAYARNQEEADRLNLLKDVFVVKDNTNN